MKAEPGTLGELVEVKQGLAAALLACKIAVERMEVAELTRDAAQAEASKQTMLRRAAQDEQIDALKARNNAEAAADRWRKIAGEAETRHFDAAAERDRHIAARGDMEQARFVAVSTIREIAAEIERSDPSDCRDWVLTRFGARIDQVIELLG